MHASEQLVEAMNRQIGREMAASLQYTSIAAYFDGETLPELARFFYRQADEDVDFLDDEPQSGQYYTGHLTQENYFLVGIDAAF